MMRQRIRWARGHILAFFESGWGLFKNLFKAKGLRNKFMTYDMLLFIAPKSLFLFIRNIIKALLFVFVYCNVTELSFSLFGHSFTISGITAGILTVLSWRVVRSAGSYFGWIFIAIYVFFTERKRIKKIKFSKKVLYCLTWPVFDFVGMWMEYVAPFIKVTWKPIPHKSRVSIDEVKENICVGSGSRQ